MAEKLAELRQKGGGISIDLLGQNTIASTSTTTWTINSISGYKYLLFSMRPFNQVDGKYAYLLQSVDNQGVAILAVDYFKTDSAVLCYTTGGAGSANFRTATFTYASDTSVSQVNNHSGQRTFYIYGIK